MRVVKRLMVVAAVAGVALSTAVASAGAGAPKWTDFGSGTGVHSVTYNGFSSLMSKSGSGIVEQWIEPGAVGGPYGSYYLFKPLTYGSITTSFQKSCDSQGLVGSTFPAEWFYNSASYTPAGVLAPYFPFNGEKYWVCQYDLYSHAQGDLTFDAFGVNNRHVVFSVHTGSPFGPAGGTYTYTDTDGTYTVNVTGVTITSTTVAFTGQVTSFTNPSHNWGDVTGWYFSGLYDQTANTWAGTWGPTPPADAGAGYAVTSGGATIYVR